MCFAPQRRALFRHLNLQKWSEPGVLCTFWLPNVLRATTACNFSTSQLPKEIRTWGVFSFFTWTYASRHNACNFSSRIWPHGSVPAALASLLFDPPEPHNHWKTQCMATLPPFPPPASSFSWLLLFSSLIFSFLLFSSLLFFSLLFSSLLLSSRLVSSLLFISLLFSSLTLPTSAFPSAHFVEVWLLNFLRWRCIYIYIYKFIYLYKCMYVKYIIK